MNVKNEARPVHTLVFIRAPDPEPVRFTTVNGAVDSRDSSDSHSGRGHRHEEIRVAPPHATRHVGACGCDRSRVLQQPRFSIAIVVAAST